MGRYIGITDEPLCQEGRAAILKGNYPKVHRVYASPMKRCLETAALIYPEADIRKIDLLRECDFGSFENKNYLELSGNPDYQAWIDSNGQLPFPGGEDSLAFRRRCREGFRQVIGDMVCSICHNTVRDVKGKWRETGEMPREQYEAAVVVHGGTIMSILEAFGDPKEDFYHWQVKNGEGFGMLLDEELYGSAGQIRLYEIQKLEGCLPE